MNETTPSSESSSGVPPGIQSPRTEVERGKTPEGEKVINNTKKPNTLQRFIGSITKISLKDSGEIFDQIGKLPSALIKAPGGIFRGLRKIISEIEEKIPQYPEYPPQSNKEGETAEIVETSQPNEEREAIEGSQDKEKETKEAVWRRAEKSNSDKPVDTTKKDQVLGGTRKKEAETEDYIAPEELSEDAKPKFELITIEDKFEKVDIQPKKQELVEDKKETEEPIKRQYNKTLARTSKLRNRIRSTGFGDVAETAKKATLQTGSFAIGATRGAAEMTKDVTFGVAGTARKATLHTGSFAVEATLGAAGAAKEMTLGKKKDDVEAIINLATKIQGADEGKRDKYIEKFNEIMANGHYDDSFDSYTAFLKDNPSMEGAIYEIFLASSGNDEELKGNIQSLIELKEKIVEEGDISSLSESYKEVEKTVMAISSSLTKINCAKYIRSEMATSVEKQAKAILGKDPAFKELKSDFDEVAADPRKQSIVRFNDLNFIYNKLLNKIPENIRTNSLQEALGLNECSNIITKSKDSILESNQEMIDNAKKRIGDEINRLSGLDEDEFIDAVLSNDYQKILKDEFPGLENLKQFGVMDSLFSTDSYNNATVKELAILELMTGKTELRNNPNINKLYNQYKMELGKEVASDRDSDVLKTYETIAKARSKMVTSDLSEEFAVEKVKIQHDNAIITRDDESSNKAAFLAAQELKTTQEAFVADIETLISMLEDSSKAKDLESEIAVLKNLHASQKEFVDGLDKAIGDDQIDSAALAELYTSSNYTNVLVQSLIEWAPTVAHVKKTIGSEFEGENKATFMRLVSSPTQNVTSKMSTPIMVMSEQLKDSNIQIAAVSTEKANKLASMSRNNPDDKRFFYAIDELLSTQKGVIKDIDYCIELLEGTEYQSKLTEIRSNQEKIVDLLEKAISQQEVNPSKINEVFTSGDDFKDLINSVAEFEKIRGDVSNALSEEKHEAVMQEKATTIDSFLIKPMQYAMRFRMTLEEAQKNMPEIRQHELQEGLEFVKFQLADLNRKVDEQNKL